MKSCMCSTKNSKTGSRQMFMAIQIVSYRTLSFWHVRVCVCMCVLLCVEVNVHVCKAQVVFPRQSAGLLF